MPDRGELTLAINETDTHCDVEIAVQAAGDYGLGGKDAERVLRQVRVAVASWRREATALKIPNAEQDSMAEAFAC